jgi:S1-C subfamily serine protease
MILSRTSRIFHPGIAFLFWAALLATLSCTRAVIYIDQEPGTGEYLTGFPIGNTAPHLEKIQRSVKRITSTSHYETYLFEPGSRVVPGQLTSASSLESLASTIVQSHTTSSGTAIVIHNQDNLVGMVTTRHIIASPDTLFEYFETGRPYLSSVTIKKNQVNWLFDAPYIGTFDILAEDELADLAVIGARVDPSVLDVPLREQFPVFPHPFGRPERLRVGTFTYNFGYPRGYPMVTTAIVSHPRRDRHHSFVTDGLFNPGFSGGAVVAVNGGLPEFEWVGMARSTSASREWFLVPDEDAAMEHQPHLPFDGEIFSEQKALIHYGITHVISSTQIRKVLEDNAIYLLSRGYNVLPLLQRSN